jgi:hypothetical protein
MSHNEFYDGSNVLSPLTTFTGLPIDQVIFVVRVYFEKSDCARDKS